MHELSVTQSILEIASSHARQADAQRITDIYLVIGDLSSFVDESIRYYWDIISQGTLAQGANLHFERIPARVECEACGTSYALAGMDALMACPQCGSSQMQVTGGREFYVESITVEEN